MSDPNYYAIIPANVRYDDKLCANAKLLYGEITALANKHGYCFASNAYFEKLYSVSKRSIQLWITSLEQNKYIAIDIIKERGNQRLIFISHKTSLGGEENFTTPSEENYTHNNTSINNTYNTSKDSLNNEEDPVPVKKTSKRKSKDDRTEEEKLQAKLKGKETYERNMLVLDYWHSKGLQETKLTTITFRNLGNAFRRQAFKDSWRDLIDVAAIMSTNFKDGDWKPNFFWLTNAATTEKLQQGAYSKFKLAVPAKILTPEALKSREQYEDSQWQLVYEIKAIIAKHQTKAVKQLKPMAKMVSLYDKCDDKFKKIALEQFDPYGLREEFMKEIK